MKNIVLKYALLLAVGFCLSGGSPARAADSPKRLTNSMIEDFYSLSARMYKADFDSFLLFMDQSMHPDVKGYSNVSIYLPGQPPLQSSEISSKDKIMAAARENYDAMNKATVQNVISGITISPDGMKATVHDKNIFTGMILPGSQGQLSANGQGDCIDIVVLDTIKGYLKFLKQTAKLL